MYRSVSRSSDIFLNDKNDFPTNYPDTEPAENKITTAFINYYDNHRHSEPLKSKNSWTPIYDNQPWIPMNPYPYNRPKNIVYQLHKPRQTTTTVKPSFNKHKRHEAFKATDIKLPPKPTKYSHKLPRFYSKPSDYQRKTRRKWRNSSKPSSRRSKKSGNYFHSKSTVIPISPSIIQKRISNIDMNSRTNLSSLVALSIIGSLLAV